ncbi:unnamed protein product [Urochloa humidicola]
MPRQMRARVGWCSPPRRAPCTWTLTGASTPSSTRHPGANTTNKQITCTAAPRWMAEITVTAEAARPAAGGGGAVPDAAESLNFSSTHVVACYLMGRGRCAAFVDVRDIARGRPGYERPVARGQYLCVVGTACSTALSSSHAQGPGLGVHFAEEKFVRAYEAVVCNSICMQKKGNCLSSNNSRPAACMHLTRYKINRFYYAFVMSC